MFYIVELEEGKFVLKHEMLGIYIVNNKEGATVFNKEKMKQFFQFFVMDNEVYDDEEERYFKIKKIHCLDVRNEIPIEDFIKIL